MVNKKALILICLFILSVSSLGCSETKPRTEPLEKKTYTGYISIDGNKLKLDDFEFITADDTQKIKELGLTESDMPDGYYIQNTSEEVKTFILDDQTSYTFFDVGNLFVKEEDDKKYTTTSQDEFKTFLYGEKAGDDPRRTPFEVEVSEEKVISIQEIFVN